MRRLLLSSLPRSASALASAGGLVILSRASASAHGDLVDGSPGPGDDIAVGTTSVRLDVTALDPDTMPLVAILDPAGNPVAVGTASLSDEQTLRATSAPLSAGVHTLDYSVLSDDGDRQNGEFTVAVSSSGLAVEPQDCADPRLAEPGEARTLEEMASGTVPVAVPYGLGGLAMLTAGLVILRVRADRRGAQIEDRSKRSERRVSGHRCDEDAPDRSAP